MLSNGENVEPQPIEDAVCAKTELVDQLMCVGQDQKALGALVVPNVRQLARAGLVSPGVADRWQEILGKQVLVNGIEGSLEELREMEGLLQGDKAVRKALLEDIAAAMGKDFQDFERIGAVAVVLEPFNMANGHLTQTLKVKRNVVADAYAEKVKQMYV